MVFQTVVNLVRCPGPDKFWRKRKIFKLSAHYYGRRRNCYSIAIKAVHHALQYATKARKLKKQDMQDLWDQRITAGIGQFGISLPSFQECNARNDIMLNRKSLADLAGCEPKSFEAIARIARERAIADNLYGINEPSTNNKVYIFEPENERK